MKKYLFLVGLLTLTCSVSFAQTQQENAEKKVFLGVNNDEKDYLIGAPSDNWFIGFGGGVQTFIANEFDKSAIWNPITPAVYVEVGKWILPDIALSLNFSGVNSVSTTRYSLNPFTDYYGIPNPTGTLDYNKIKFMNFALNGLVTLDWTNLFCGYEKGANKKVHILTPIGMGCAWVTGQNVNQNPKVKGTKANNFELDFVAAIIPEITLSENLRLVPAVRFQLERGSLDYSGRTYDSAPTANQSKVRCDFQPAVTIGLKFNLSGTKGGTHKTRYKGEVANEHIFVPAENSSTYKYIKEQYDNLAAEEAGLKNDLADANAKLGAANAATAAALAALAAQKADNEALAAGAAKRALSPMEEILLNAESGNLLTNKTLFELNSSKLSDNAKAKIVEFAKAIKDSDEKTKFIIAGAADKATGNEKLNYNLSVDRAKSIYNVLVKECGVYPGKLEMRPLGGISEYGDIELNRLGLIVEGNDAIFNIFNKFSKKY